MEGGFGGREGFEFVEGILWMGYVGYHHGEHHSNILRTTMPPHHLLIPPLSPDCRHQSIMCKH